MNLDTDLCFPPELCFLVCYIFFAWRKSLIHQPTETAQASGSQSLERYRALEIWSNEFQWAIHLHGFLGKKMGGMKFFGCFFVDDVNTVCILHIPICYLYTTCTIVGITYIQSSSIQIATNDFKMFCLLKSDVVSNSYFCSPEAFNV